MHLLYADDSGSPTDPTQQYFVLAGLSVFERQPHWLASKLDLIASRFNEQDPDSIELHGSPMYTGRGAWRRVPRADRMAAIADALRILSIHRANSPRVFVAAINKAAVSPTDPVEVAFEQLASRFDKYLLRLFRRNNPQRGLIVFDKSTRETSIQSLATEFKRTGHQWGRLRNQAEVPVFVDSKASRLVQLADLIAYAALRKFERGDSSLFDIVEPYLDSEGGIVHGLFHRP